MSALATVTPDTLPAARKPTADERWDTWRAHGAVQDARTARQMRVVMAVVIVIGIAAATVVLL